MGELLGRGDLEARDRAALRVERGHDLADRAVLAGGVDALEDDEHRPPPLGPQPLLELGQAVEQPVGDDLCPFLVEAECRTRIDVAEVDAPARRDAQSRAQIGCLGHASSVWLARASSSRGYRREEAATSQRI